MVSPVENIGRAVPPVGERWLAAALLGSLWAAVEIILGNFLHLSGQWFAGTILAALGVALMSAGAQIWPFKGLLWRAGIICALMKSVSPGAVVIGPMVGIALEGLIMEGTTRAFGRNWAGILIGGGLATALPVIQRIVSVLVVFGFDAARLYISLYETAARAIHLESIGPADLVFGWLTLHLAFGVGAAWIGMLAGARARRIPDPSPPPPEEGSVFSLGAPDPEQIFSRTLLLAHVMLMPLGFVAIRTWPLLFSLPAIAVYAGLTFLLYPRIRRRFSRPRIWIEFLVVSAIAGVTLGGIASPGGFQSSEGLRIGMEMALRAVLVVIAFSAISIELRNPIIVHWFLRRGLSSVSSALDVAFQALPAMMHAIGEERWFFRHPLSSVARVIATARGWLARFTHEGPGVIAIITGDRGSGKTGFAERCIPLCVRRGIRTAGILAPVILKNGERIGYRVRNIATGAEIDLCRRASGTASADVGPFAFHPEGIALGEEALRIDSDTYPDVVILDEVGPLELSGKGWADALTRLRTTPIPALILVVRPSLINDVVGRWNFSPQAIWNSREDGPETAVEWLVRTLPTVDPSSPPGASHRQEQ